MNADWAELTLTTIDGNWKQFMKNKTKGSWKNLKPYLIIYLKETGSFS